MPGPPRPPGPPRLPGRPRAKGPKSRKRRKHKNGKGKGGTIVPPAAAEHALALSIQRQPDDTTCGPTCLHAVYQYLGDPVPLESVIEETPTLDDGGTLAVLLGSHALRRGYRATMYTYNLQVFDPTWFAEGAPPLAAKLQELAEGRSDRKIRTAARAYVDYLALGGRICFEDLTSELLRRYLKRGIPILTGLSSTFLYRSARELPRTNESDDVHGYPAGHFVVLTGYREESREVRVADPWHPHSVEKSRSYWVGMSRLVNSILLGIVTYDANLLIVERTEPSDRPRAKSSKDRQGAHTRRRQ